MMFQIIGPGYSTGTNGIFNNFSNLFVKRSFQNNIALIITRLLPFAIVMAGIFFFIKLITAGYGYLTSAGDSGKIQNATKEITNALIGLIIIISSYFLVQLIQVIFGVTIL